MSGRGEADIWVKPIFLTDEGLRPTPHLLFSSLFVSVLAVSTATILNCQAGAGRSTKTVVVISGRASRYEFPGVVLKGFQQFSLVASLE